jgi:Lipid A 3-O-deacylase (PagL)
VAEAPVGPRLELRALLGGVLLLLPGSARGADPGVIVFSAGQFDTLQADDRAIELGVQWRGGGWLWRRRVAPMAGTMTTTDGALLGYAGLSLDIPIGGRGFILRASVAPGAYARGDGKDLHSVFQVRSGLETGWRFRGGARLGLELEHISNASTTDYNPGETSVLVLVTVPLSAAGGR